MCVNDVCHSLHIVKVKYTKENMDTFELIYSALISFGVFYKEHFFVNKYK